MIAINRTRLNDHRYGIYTKNGFICLGQKEEINLHLNILISFYNNQYYRDEFLEIPSVPNHLIHLIPR